MRRVRGKNTGPEIRVRQVLHAEGYRFRLHASELPGCPDIVFRPRRKAIFVHGCFWHRHERCALARLPKSRLDFWLPKLEGNRERDKKKLRELRKQGWSVFEVWECEVGDKEMLARRLHEFLESGEHK